jgi:hypothetical protein
MTNKTLVALICSLLMRSVIYKNYENIIVWKGFVFPGVDDGHDRERVDELWVDQDDDVLQSEIPFFDVLGRFSPEDMIQISIVLGMSSFRIPWWTGISLLGCIRSTLVVVRLR